MIDNILKEAIECGIVDVTTIYRQVEEMKKKEILDNHNYKIWQGKDGGWFTYLPDKTKNKGRRLIRKSSLVNLENEIVEFYKNKIETDTFEKVFKKWAKEKLEFNHIAKGTYDRYENDFKRFFGNTDLKTKDIRYITEKELELFIKKSISNDNLTAKAYAGMRTIILGTFKYAKSNGLTNISISTFFKDLDLSKKAFVIKRKSVEEQVFMDSEARMLIDYLSDSGEIRDLGIILAFQTGVREGELAALKFSDIRNNKIHVERQEIRYKGKDGKAVHEVVDYTKSEAGNRFIYLTPKALVTIQRIKELNPDGEYLFIYNGKRYYAQNFNNRLKNACQKVGIPIRSMHKIRKTFGTTLLDADTPDSLVMQMMGHSDIETTRKYYWFSNKSDDKKAEIIANAIDF